MEAMVAGEVLDGPVRSFIDAGVTLMQRHTSMPRSKIPQMEIKHHRQTTFWRQTSGLFPRPTHARHGPCGLLGLWPG